MNTTWYGFRAIELQNNHVSVTVVPDLGGKLVSLYDMHHNYEWLSSPTNLPGLRDATGRFISYELCGWDEMFPSINASPYPSQLAYQIADHGEVWRLPWQVIASQPDAVTMAVEGEHIGYRLKRTLLVQENQITFRYQLQNLRDADLVYLWAAHPLFRLTPATQIVLDDVAQVINTQTHSLLAGVGEALAWPASVGKGGKPIRLDVLNDVDWNESRKHYLLPDECINSVELRNPQCVLRMHWDASHLPYFGIWIDGGKYTQHPTVALEPTTGYFDHLQRAHASGRSSTLGHRASKSWELSVSLT